MTDYSRYTIPPFPTRAVIIVRGIYYYEWTSVSVRFELNGNPPRTFRFTASEQIAPRDDFALLQIVPPDPCQIYLDGYLAIDGYVTTRQVYYSATEHAVEIQGEAWAGWLAKMPAQSQTGEFKNQPAVPVMQALAAPAGVGVSALGAVGDFAFPRISLQPGESAWEAIERLARQVGGVISSDAGRNLLIIGPGSSLGAAEVVEGINIVEARETIHILMNAAEQSVIGQSGRTDGTDQSTATQGHITVPGLDSYGITADVGARSLAEMPAFSLEMLQSRAQHEANISGGMDIRVDLTLAGWERPGGGIWQPYDTVTVNSPMLVMFGMPLILWAVTFTQDDRGGTRATIELTNQPVSEQPFTSDSSSSDSSSDTGTDV